MSEHEFMQMVQSAVAAAEQDNTLVALVHLENATHFGSTPTLTSYLGYCLARERRQFKTASGLCIEALKQEPEQVVHYLNLGRIYLEAGQKGLAIKTFRQGLRVGRNRIIVRELKKLGFRKQPVFVALPRSHPLNKYSGLAFSFLGAR